MFFLFLYLVLALVVSFICSIMEAVLLSTPRAFIIVKENEGLPWANLLSKHKQHIDTALAAILTLNTIAHTVGAAGVGAEAVKVFGSNYFGIISAGLTILILVFTEIIPKTIGAQYYKSLARITAYTIRVMIIITWPLIKMSSVITRLISKSSEGHTTSREEISALAGIGAEEGMFHEQEYKILQNLLRLKNVKVDEVMTPRIVVAAANEEMLLTEFIENKAFLHFSRIPVFKGREEEVTGYVFRKSAFEILAKGDENISLKDIKREITVVPNSKPLFALWETLLHRKEHIALVVDEYGGMDGIVTMEDIIETFLGLEIVDETDDIVDMQQYARERWESRQAKYQMIDK